MFLYASERVMINVVGIALTFNNLLKSNFLYYLYVHIGKYMRLHYCLS